MQSAARDTDNISVDMEIITDSVPVFVFRDAWNSLGEMPKEEAMTAYVDDLKLVRCFGFFSSV